MEARRIKTPARSPCSPTPPPCRRRLRGLYEFLRPGVRENEAVGLVAKKLYDSAPSTSRRQRHLRRTLLPASHVYSDRLIRPATRLLRHPAQLQRLPDCYYRTFAVGSQPAQRDAYTRPGVHGPRHAAVRPGATTPTSSPVAHCHGVRLSRRGSRLRSPVRPWRRPVDLGEAIFSAWSPSPTRAIEEGMVFALETYWPSVDGVGAARIEEELGVTASAARSSPSSRRTPPGRRRGTTQWTVHEPLAGSPIPPQHPPPAEHATIPARADRATTPDGGATTPSRPLRPRSTS